MAASKALLPLLLIGGGVAAAVIAGSAKGDTGEPGEDDTMADRPPGRPVVQGGKIVLRGFKSNAGGVKVTFQIEQVAGDQSGKGEFFGVVFQPWDANQPAIVAQAPTRQEARDATIAFVSADEHGLPP
jgi:hypothetical protein